METSGEKAGVRSSSKKQSTANRGGKAPGKARPVAGAFGKETSRGKSARKPAAKVARGQRAKAGGRRARPKKRVA